MACAPIPAQAQEASPAQVLARADSVYFAGGPAEAVAILETVGDARGAAWRVIRSMTALSLLAPPGAERDQWLARGLEVADRILEGGTPDTETLYWVGAVEGLRSLTAEARDAGELALRAQRHAQLILTVDSLHGGAHNILGRVNYEIMILSRARRFLGRLVLGDRFPRDISWEGAERHLRRATESWPHVVLFHLDLARLYERRERWAEARQAAVQAVQTPSLHPPDDRLKEEARAVIRRLDALPPRSPPR